MGDESHNSKLILNYFFKSVDFENECVAMLSTIFTAGSAIVLRRQN